MSNSHSIRVEDHPGPPEPRTLYLPAGGPGEGAADQVEDVGAPAGIRIPLDPILQLDQAPGGRFTPTGNPLVAEKDPRFAGGKNPHHGEAEGRHEDNLENAQ